MKSGVSWRWRLAVGVLLLAAGAGNVQAERMKTVTLFEDDFSSYTVTTNQWNNSANKFWVSTDGGILTMTNLAAGSGCEFGAGKPLYSFWSGTNGHSVSSFSVSFNNIRTNAGSADNHTIFVRWYPPSAYEIRMKPVQDTSQDNVVIASRTGATEKTLMSYNDSHFNTPNSNNYYTLTFGATGLTVVLRRGAEAVFASNTFAYSDSGYFVGSPTLNTFVGGTLLIQDDFAVGKVGRWFKFDDVKIEYDYPAPPSGTFVLIR
jgi:hypothetical protein